MDARERRVQAMMVLIGCKVGERSKCHKDNGKGQHRKVSSIKSDDAVKHSHEMNRVVYKSCAKKKAYQSQGIATLAMHQAEQRFGKVGKGKVYYCDICHRYHISFSKNRH